MKVGIIIQARMSSSRLPGKVMLKLAGKAVLWHIVERCKRSQLANIVIVATSTDKQDDVIYDFCNRQGITVFRGDLDDVLARYYDCARQYGLDIIVRVTGDCPLIDPLIIDESLKLFLQNSVSYVSNILKRIFPRGLDCEVFSFAVLKEANLHAKKYNEREHVTPYIRAHATVLPYIVPTYYCGSERLTLDELADYLLFEHIYNKFYKKNTIISVPNVLTYLRSNSEVVRLNLTVKQKS